MKRSFRARSALLFWLMAIGVAVYWSYSEQKELKTAFTITEGKVIDEVNLRVGRSDVMCPQISYFVNGEELFFADKSLNMLSLGDKVDVMYQTDYPQNAYVYDLGYWVNYRVIILTFLLAFVGFGLVWGLTQKFSKGKEMLPSNTPF